MGNIKPIISSFKEDLDFHDFNCGVGDVNEYLKNKACKQEKGRITKIYVIHVEKRIIAYSAVFCSHLYFKLPEQSREFRVPGICIGQLGVDLKFQGKGFAKVLVKHAISLAYKINNYSGCRIIYVDAIDTAVDYYKNLHFFLIESKPNRNKMVFDLCPL